jgi:hypothetical protein
VNLDVIPVQGQSLHERLYVVVFQDAVPAAATVPAGKHEARKALPKQNSLAHENARLAQEIAQQREQLQLLIEDHEITSEEFKSANEEVLSANEELQSTNEELETATEELQSSNEELTTLNEELQNRNIELSLSKLFEKRLIATVRNAKCMSKRAADGTCCACGLTRHGITRLTGPLSVFRRGFTEANSGPDATVCRCVDRERTGGDVDSRCSIPSDSGESSLLPDLMSLAKRLKG